MTSERTITPEEFERDTLTILLAAGDIAHERAAALARQITDGHWKLRRGTRTYWCKGRKPSGLDLPQRKAIYLEWWTYRDDAKLILKWDISEGTLARIKTEGRAKRWERCS